MNLQDVYDAGAILPRVSAEILANSTVRAKRRFSVICLPERGVEIVGGGCSDQVLLVCRSIESEMPDSELIEFWSTIRSVDCPPQRTNELAVLLRNQFIFFGDGQDVGQVGKCFGKTRKQVKASSTFDGKKESARFPRAVFTTARSKRTCPVQK
jgi:hypothetical protein